MEVRSKLSCGFEDQFEHEHAGYLSAIVIVRDGTALAVDFD
jgi:hypothetical protein